MLANSEKGPLVSIVMPVYNGEKFIRQALDSLYEDNYRPIEVVVVDDGSSDGTAQIIKRYKDARYILQDHKGVAAARNTGVAAAKGEIIGFLDHDDISQPDRFTNTVRHFQEHPHIGYVLAKQIMFIETGYEVPGWVNPEWLVTPQDASNTAVLVGRRETFERVGQFNPLIGGEDTEWLVRANELGIPMTRLPDVVLRRRIHGENLSIQMLGDRKANLLQIARESIRRRQKEGGES